MIIAVIEHEAEEEVSRILKDAERQASETVAAAEAQVQAQVDGAIERLGPEIRAASRRRVNAVRLRLLEQRARDDAARLMAVFESAEAQVAAIAGGADPSRWSTALGALCAEALGAVGAGGMVKVRAADVDLVSTVAEAWRAQVVSIAGDEEAGLTVGSSDGRIEVDAHLSVRLERARTLLAEEVAQMLRLATVEQEPGSAA